MVAGTSRSAQQKALRHVAARSAGAPLAPGLELTVNFHPDRTAGDRPLLRRMAEDGVYYSQFVTGTSNGGLTAHPGGDRWRWESRIFGGAYDHARLCRRIAVDGCLDPWVIGRAARAGRYDPQALKKVWQCLARFGAPQPAAGPTPKP